ncbi:RAB6-interacting golgin [Periplaneta americana]|uniref:RAB6-interacting golgin n=1 Tax=Periplaneta americana TaxID=6978 RepID=UPI0037E8FE33
MAKWEGFTDEDIQKVSACERLIEAQPQPTIAVRVAKRQASIAQSSGKKNVTRSRMLQKSQQPVEPNNCTDKMPKEAFLSKPKDVVCMETDSATAEVSSDSGCGVSSTTETPSVTSNTASPSTSPSHGTVCLRIKEGKSYEVLSAEKGNISSASLDEFQSRQKLMEEQNRQRKELLAKALADRKKQTTEEARRLQQIQDELQKLDMLLSNDVSILRDQIEVASHEFMEAQKRYNKAEKEFLDAKLILFDKLERKEMLTEHLCTIIEQNEIRKARKLSELMDKLQLGATVTDVCEGDRKNVILSPLCALDEVSYSFCNTLKSRSVSNKSESINSTESNDKSKDEHIPLVSEGECISNDDNQREQQVEKEKTCESSTPESGN